MLQDSIHQEFLCGSRAGQFLDRLVNFRKQTVAEPAQIIRASLRLAALGVGNPSLPQYAADTRQHVTHSSAEPARASLLRRTNLPA